ncbi:cytochrome C oxidase subunit II [Thiohalorhabdus methylotrophus]|uniref:Cytochrome C oxidase subunit II n=1 Tax=Thiohalorhabdus methylotrophus TaxID=3242694 RepID=A0ABV4TYP0_9GAMM
MHQEIAWQVSLLGILFIAAVFLFVFLRSSDSTEYGPVQKRFYRVRAFWFWALVAVGGWLSVETLASLPYAATHGQAEQSPAVAVDVTGHQWYWDMSRTEVPAGRTVEFRITSADVNHGFAIYNADREVVAQTQAMPGYTNKLRHTFREPGTYKVMCLEYCGLAHHNMTAQITVTAREG